ncbi:hypothetical protein [Mesorhizobium sp. B2-3-4]|uniref:hypothetical protein n=1 Tax=Mesorhizobium sp. B2-3-4 TaxID=2589959 RepID=UPI0011298B90|nr:hypothetical protein [Mesorhizobium sp. B2-3-4]TPM25684.1 hypothetical protein FJ967_32160 [Mesorhizobium sp. B2-3-4]
MTAPNLHDLIAAHRSALAAWDAVPDAEWDSPEASRLGSLADVARDALFAHRPATLDEVGQKTAYMASCRAFTEWEDFDRAKLIEALSPDVAGIEALIQTYIEKRDAYRALDPDCNGGPEWDAYGAAEHDVIVFPCTTLADVQTKARFFIENASAYDTIRNCSSGNEETLYPFLRSLLGEAPR